MERIAILGGGSAGLMLARLLQLQGRSVTLFERDAHAAERPQGGSLDLHADTGQRALRCAGLQAAFDAVARPEDQGHRLFDADGMLLHDHAGGAGDRPEIDRSALRDLLIASLQPGTVRWGSPVTACRPGKDGVQVESAGELTSFDLVVGAEGAWSPTRRLLTEAVPTYEGVVLVEIGYDANQCPEVDALTGRGKMFAVGDNQALITQRNGGRHLRAYAGLRLGEAEARAWTTWEAPQLRHSLRSAFAGWSAVLQPILESGDILAVRPIYGLPAHFRWESRPGVTLIGDAAHLMSPFAGLGVNLALADAVDLAEAIASGEGWPAITAFETAMMTRAAQAARDSAEGLRSIFSSLGAQPVLDHFRAVAAA